MSRPLCLLLLALLPATAAAEPQLRAGAATGNITPPLGGEIVGGFVPIPSTHVHDELHVRVLVLDDGETQIALAVCDLLGIHRLLSDEARRLIAEEAGIPKERVLLSATHTHSATSALGTNRFAHEQQLSEYQKFVARRIADAVRCAVHRLEPAELAFGSVEAPEHVFNRRWLMRPGTVPENPFGGSDLVKMNPPAGSPNLVEPAGPVDPTLSFLAVRRPGGSPIALFASYGLHYVGGVPGGHISADYFALFCEGLKRKLGLEEQDPPFVALLANGTSGDVNNINFREPRGRRAPYEQMRYVADDLVRRVHAALPELEYRANLSLAAAYREPAIAYRRPTEEQLAWAEKILAAEPQDPRDLSSIYARRTMSLKDYPAEENLPLQVFRIGPVCLGTMPCEVFTEIGLDFKSRSPLQPALLISLAHGYYGYLPTPRQHALGGYETWLGTNRLEPEASTKMTRHLLEMAAELKP